MSEIPLPQGTTRYNSHSNRGRKKLVTLSAEERSQQMREAQRALRARKKDYLEDLEQEETKLILENVLLKQQVQTLLTAVPTTMNEVPCLNQNCEVLIQALQMQVSNLKLALINNASISNASTGKSAFIGSNTYFGLPEPDHGGISDWIIDTGDEMTTLESESKRSWPCAEELYGPIEIEPFKSRILALEPFRNHPKIANRIFDLLMRIAKTTETRSARSLLLKIIREHLRLVDRCGIIGRVQVIEIMAEYRLKYAKHAQHWHKMCAFSEYKPKQNPLLRENIPPRVVAFRDALKSIPSFAECQDTIDNMCDFWVADYEYNPQEFFNLNYMVHSLIIACTNIEDQRRFWFAFYIVRQSRHHEM
ncbi:hypothetical protein HK100_001845, partial [Physocladia obscura]